MGLGVGLLLAAVGAVLAFAVNATVSGVDIHTIGWILLIVGIVGILLSMIFWSSWAGPGYFSRRRTLRRRGPGRTRRSPVLEARARRNRTWPEPGSGRVRMSRQAIGSSRKNDEPVRPSESTQMRPFIRVTSSLEM